MDLLPHAAVVRLFSFQKEDEMRTLKWLLTSTALLASPVAAEMLDLEKDELTFGFIKLTDMAPLAVAYELGVF